jgi:hypothetical protein
MRIADYVITAAVVAGLSGTAMAQTPSTTQTPSTQPAPVAVVVPTSDPYVNHWVASAFVGSNFGTNSRDNLVDILGTDTGSSINWGGQIAYMWRGYVGAEGLFEFAPSFSMDNLLFDGNPTVNTYMLNLIGAIPVGSENQFFPYASGGFGAVQLRSDIFTLTTAAVPSPAPIVTIGTVSADATRFGGNIGGGVYGFAGSWGFRGDIRYYRSSTVSNLDVINDTAENIFARDSLSGLSFWKANVGVAFRW